VPKVTVLAIVRTGNIDEGESTWLADVAVEMLKEGTVTRTAAGIAESAAAMGGTLGVGAGAEQTSVGISVLSEHAVAAVDLVADVLRNPRFPETELPRIIANLERSVAVARSDPSSQAGEALARLVYGDHPFGRTLPRDGQLAAYGMDDVRGFYQRNFGALRTHVYVAGRYDRAALEAALRRSFGDWTAGPAPSVLPPTPGETLRLELIDVPGAQQSSVRIAVPVPHPAHALYFSDHAHEQPARRHLCRASTNIREDKGYSYSPDSSITRAAAAPVVLSAEVTSEHTRRRSPRSSARSSACEGGAPGAELDAVKAYRSGLFVIANSSPNGVLGQLAFMNLHGLPDSFLTHWVASIHAVTPAEVSDMAARFVRPERMTVVVAGDLAKIGASVRALPQFEKAAVP
jgi:predicted Zn-dependent peptidase